MRIYSYLLWFISRSYWRIRLELLDMLNPPLDGFFRNRRIIIIGPAAGVQEDSSKVDVNGFDVIVRVNSGVRHAIDAQGFLGTRTDVLFHNFKEAGERSAGLISPDLVSAHSVKRIIYPTLTAATLPKYLRTKKELESRVSKLNISFLPPAMYRSLSKKFYPYHPTIGSIAINYFLSSQFEELCIIGFSLFKTGYDLGYNGKAGNLSDARKWVESGGVHNPDVEFHVTSAAIKDAIKNGKNISLGNELSQMLGCPEKAVGKSQVCIQKDKDLS